MRRDPWVWLLLGVLLIAGVVAAAAHEATNIAGQPLGWKYEWRCCSSIDCGPVADSGIAEEPGGYRIKLTGELIPYSDKRVKDSPDGLYHWCAHKAGIDAGKTICLYRAPRGF
jgi:hypothetical protein